MTIELERVSIGGVWQWQAVNEAGGGGGSEPSQAQYSGAPVAIANNGLGALTWDSLVAGSDLLDRSDLANPLFLTPGCYAVSLTVVTDAPLTSGGYAAAQITFGDLAVIPSITTTLHPEAVGGGAMLTAVAVVEDISEPLKVTVSNFDGVASRNFFLGDAAIVKLSDAGSPISEITSGDASVTITDPTGPTVDLSVAVALAAVLAEGNDANGLKITNLDDPASDQDAATKKYVDDNAGGLPAGGTTGQVLTKESNADGDAGWEDAGGGAAPGVLTSADFLFTETAGAGTYTATLPLEAGSVAVEVGYWREADFDADTAALDAHVDTAGVEFFSGEPVGNPGVGEYVSAQVNTGGAPGPFIFPVGIAVPELGADTVTLALVTTGAGGTTGRLRVKVCYFTPATTTNAVKS